MQTGNDEWIYDSFEYRFLKEKHVAGIDFANFDIFWYELNKNVYIVTSNEDATKILKQQIKANALEIYNTFIKGYPHNA